ncbi:MULTISPECIES: GDSL-type esterase/lipase family protein [unclassified Corynebacterium]|uniref:GDSL-type esterase/lipase family protein n=1 Tax=unclassified Corynebacterium TaxID=2624378 RepID=UPI001EF49762|nr:MULTISPECIES: GDSL-type esterase/lipase family protein [unclassified Corynebacterium]MCG7288625.1 GDSL-type esterase/lipase family protein [Corynebacterium sp. ACRPZ]MCG7293069.1 GDSL-type esterase/lipase family protein [Corynebacterium sp. ACRPY]
MKALFRRVTAGIAACAALVASTAAPATAQPTGNVVVFGDSFASSPDQYRNSALNFTGISKLSSGSSERLVSSYPSQAGCLQGPDNWPRQLQARTGLTVADWSCTGHQSASLPGHVDLAVRAGDLNANTRAVTLAVGFNDHWRPLVESPGAPYNADAVRDNYFRNMHEAVAKVRAAAPRAKILIPGMLSVTGGTERLCLINVMPNAPLGVPAPRVQQWEQRTQSYQRALAAQLGATFIDIRALSTNHSTCARDADRWVAGLIDTTTADYNMALHPSRAGSAFVADQVAQAV